MGAVGGLVLGVTVAGALLLFGGPQKAKKKPRKAASGPWVIECRGRYWDGSTFAKERSGAKRFADDEKAWDFIDDNLSKYADDCNLVKG